MELDPDMPLSQAKIGQIVPNFTFLDEKGVKHEFKEFLKGSWVVFLSIPSTFSPVCTTEMVSLVKSDNVSQKYSK